MGSVPETSYDNLGELSGTRSGLSPSLIIPLLPHIHTSPYPEMHNIPDHASHGDFISERALGWLHSKGFLTGSKRTWEHHFMNDHKDIDCDGANWIHVAQKSDQ
jgi:hypothetical protein